MIKMNCTITLSKEEIEDIKNHKSICATKDDVVIYIIRESEREEIKL